MNTLKADGKRDSETLAREAIVKARSQARRTEAERVYAKFKSKKREDPVPEKETNTQNIVLVLLGLIGVGMTYAFANK